MVAFLLWSSILKCLLQGGYYVPSQRNKIINFFLRFHIFLIAVCQSYKMADDSHSGLHCELVVGGGEPPHLRGHPGKISDRHFAPLLAGQIFPIAPKIRARNAKAQLQQIANPFIHRHVKKPGEDGSDNYKLYYR